jgi:succinate dehydrogenase / fumarate reductase cytochrome b subunit
MLGLVQAGGAGKSGGVLGMFQSSIGKKLVVGLSGLALCGFLVVHLAGNLLIFQKDGVAFNNYAKTLTSNPLIIPMELGLTALFLAHIAMAIRITRENRIARPVRYEFEASQGGRTVASSTMIYTGLFVLLFLIVHLADFRFGPKHAIDAATGKEVMKLHELVMADFGNALRSLFYAVASCIVGVHVSHGLQSAFRTLGLVHPRYTPWVDKLSALFGGVMAIGFGSIPLWAFFAGRT